MVIIEEQKPSYPRRRHDATIEGVINTLQWVVTALVLAFVFRSFLMEAFQIPTGSMAETLRGAHYHLRCVRCGYKYDVGGDSGITPRPSCSSCGYFMPLATSMSNGDRILVLKCIYQFFEPKRWDVVVFKNPLNPEINFIKRLIAGPGETVEIVDGDMYINGQIARKPPKVQEELWMPIYDNDYQSSHRMRRSSTESTDSKVVDNVPWRQRFENMPGSNWNLNAKGSAVFALDSEEGQINTMSYNAANVKGFRSTYAYNNSDQYYLRPVCSDLMVRFHVASGRDDGLIGASLGKYGILYRGWVNFSGRMIIQKAIDNELIELTSREVDSVGDRRAVPFRFANVDHQLILEFGSERLIYDLGRGRDDTGQRGNAGQPEVEVFGAGQLTLSHVAIFRDTYHIGERVLRAGQGNPFTLGEDEFFVCGDNSPDSFDCRKWATEGIGNNGLKYTVGVVPRDYLVGKAFFIYWGDAFEPTENLPIIPNLAQLRFIYGGSDQGL